MSDVVEFDNTVPLETMTVTLIDATDVLLLADQIIAAQQGEIAEMQARLGS